MLKTIAAVSPELSTFIEALQLPLNIAQHQHVSQIADGLVTTQGDKNLSALYRHMVGNPCPKSAADTFREAPWQADNIRCRLRESQVRTAFEITEAVGAPKRVFLSLDDSLTAKDNGSKRLQVVDWYITFGASFYSENSAMLIDMGCASGCRS